MRKALCTKVSKVPHRELMPQMKNECKLYLTMVLITRSISSLQVHKNIFHKNSRFMLHSTVIVASLHERDFSILNVAHEPKGRCVFGFHDNSSTGT